MFTLFGYGCEDAPIHCENINPIEGKIEADCKKLLLTDAILTKFDKDLIIDTYDIGFEGVRNNCNEKDVLRFHVSVPRDVKLDGLFDVIPTNVNTVNKVTNYTHYVTTIDPFSFKELEEVSVQIKIKDYSNDEYSFTIEGQTLTGKVFEVKMRHIFK